MSVASFVAQLKALMPPGLVWTREQASDQLKVLNGLAPEFDRVQQRAGKLLLEMSPATASEMLPEHEAKHGLPDACAPVPVTDADRQAALLQKLEDDKRGHNPADYADLCNDNGYPGAVVARRIALPFQAGKSRAGDQARGDGWVFLYAVAYMAELIGAPNDFTSWATKVGVTVTANAKHAPDGTATADVLAFPFGTNYIECGIAGAPKTTQFDIWLRAPTEQQVLVALFTPGHTQTIVQQFVTATPYWRRLTFRGTHASGCAFIRIAGSSATVYAWGARAGAVDPVLECKLSNARQGHTVPQFRMIDDWLPTAGSH